MDISMHDHNLLTGLLKLSMRGIVETGNLMFTFLQAVNGLPFVSVLYRLLLSISLKYQLETVVDQIPSSTYHAAT